MTCATSRVVSRSSSNVSKTEEDFDEEQKPLCSNKEANNDRNESSSSPLKTTRDDDSSTAAVSWRCCNVYTIVFRCVLLVCLLSGIQFACSKALLHHQTQQRIPEGVKRFKGPPRVKDPNFKPQSKYIFQGALVSHFPDRAKDAETTKQKNTEMLALFNENHTITVADLSDLDPVELPANVTWDEAAADRGPILRILQRAGLRVDVQVLQRLPTWSQVTRLYGAAPVVVVPKGNGEQDSCAAFRARVPVATRFVGVAGQMNTGTNAISKYLAQNIEIAENNASTSKGILWTVPWYKHGWASLRFRYKYRFPEDHANVLAVVLIRDPYFWMQSMCESPYTLEWNKSKLHCPNLVEPVNASVRQEPKGVPVRIRWGKDFIRTWPSLAHLWSAWYREYVDADDMPRILVRFEDLLFHTEAVVEEIRECVGATWIDEGQFRYAAEPAKTHPYFARYKAPSSLVSAMIKYGQDDSGSARRGSMTEADLKFAAGGLDADLIEQFHYQKRPGQQ